MKIEGLKKIVFDITGCMHSPYVDVDLKQMTYRHKPTFLHVKLLMLQMFKTLKDIMKHDKETPQHFIHCHNPTNNPKKLKTTFVQVVLLSVIKKNQM